MVAHTGGTSVSPLECPGSSTGTSGKPEVPVCSAVLPLISSGTCSGAPLLFSESCTGSATGTSGKPEVPARPAVLPLLRDRRPLGSTVEVKTKRGLEVPALLAVLPAMRDGSSLQRLVFVKGYKYPFTYLGRASFSNSLSSINAIKAQSSKLKFKRSPNPSTQIRRSLED